MQTDRSPFCVRKSQFREKLAHMTGRQKQQKNRIWWNRPATQSLAAAGGALTPSFQAYEKPYDLESLSGKPAAIWGCQKYEKFCIWGVTTGNSAPDVRRGAGKLGTKRKEGRFPASLLPFHYFNGGTKGFINTHSFTPFVYFYKFNHHFL